ncbi:hypothetical protein O3M35_012765 [Rhynocoris fuscipes]|uniref:SAP30-binding protein n=1 Tax=Rhynocoris fuscipes TaxID=488301 RepID=A0AAW1CWY4_9HEMI
MELQEKISNLTEKLKSTGFNMKTIIENRKAFKNPCMYEKLISYCDINEFGTNYSPQIYDPFKWGDSSNYEALAKAQTDYIDQIDQKNKEKQKLKLSHGNVKPILNGSKKKNSRWDQKFSKVQNSIATTSNGTLPKSKK